MAWTILNSLGQIKTAIGGDHGALTGLTDDDHTQYALLAGRSTGQTIIGGTDLGDDLTLNSTSNATKGDVLVQTGGGNVIVGGGTTASRLRLLEASGSGTNYTEFVAQPQAGNITYTLPPDDGDSGEVLSTDGSGNLTWEADAGGGFTLGTYGSIGTGTSFDFTSIPSGVTMIVITFNQVSTNGTAGMVVQVGDAGGIETTTYVGRAGWADGVGTAVDVTAGLPVSTAMVAAQTLTGVVTLHLQDPATFLWVSEAVFHRSATTIVGLSSGRHDGLDSELTTVRITTTADDNFDAGNVNIAYI